MTFDLQSPACFTVHDVIHMEKLEQSHYYLRTTLSFEQVPEFSLDARQLKAIILHALQSLHGQVGAAISVDVLRCSCQSSTVVSALLRLPHNELVKVWSALTLLGSYNGCLCVFHVEQVSASLMSLAVSSRTYQFHNHA